MMLDVATEYQVVKATEVQRGSAENAEAARLCKVSRNYCEDGDRWLWSMKDVSRLIFSEKTMV